MNTAREIESAIERLPREEQDALAAWFEQRFQDRWDARMRRDADTGRLDDLYRRSNPTEVAEDVPLDEFLDDQKHS